MNYPQPHMSAPPPAGYMYPGMPLGPMNFPPPGVQYPQPMHYGQPHMPGAFNENMPPFVQPAMNTYGYTGPEMLHAQMAAAENQEMNQKQEMKPADDDPKRMYWCREPDGSWIQRNRLTIDSGDIGDIRWYEMDGKFYAVRLES